MKGNHLDNTEFIERARKIHGDRYDYSLVEYVNSKLKIIIICRQHGKFLQKPRKHLSGQGCRRCSALHNKRKSYIPLNDEDTKFLIENYGKIPFNQIATKLKRGKRILYAKLRELNISEKFVRQMKIYKDIKVSYFNALKKCAGTRATKNLCFEISIEDIWDQYIKQNKKCALSGLDILFSLDDQLKTASVDRKDSDKGYTKDNIQIVHKDINYLKMDLSEKRLYDLCKFIANFRKDFDWKKIEWEWDEWHDTERPVLVDSEESPILRSFEEKDLFNCEN